jgi:hypothetical protein
LAIAVGLSFPLQADIVFTASPFGNTTVVAGTQIMFDVSLSVTPTLIQRTRTGAAPASFSQTFTQFTVNGLDINAVAGSGNGTGGVFVPFDGTSGSQVFLLEGRPPDVSNPVGQAFATNGTFGFTTTLTSSPTLFARFVIDTTGVGEGTYDFTLNRLFANSNTVVIAPSFTPPADAVFIAGIPVSTNAIGSNVTYTITAVPEPSSIIGFGCLAALGTAFYVRRRRLAKAA